MEKWNYEQILVKWFTKWAAGWVTMGAPKGGGAMKGGCWWIWLWCCTSLCMYGGGGIGMEWSWEAKNLVSSSRLSKSGSMSKNIYKF